MDTQKENYTPSLDVINAKLQELLEFLDELATEDLVAVSIPREYLIDIGAKTDENGDVASNNVYESFVTDNRLIIKVADSPGYICDEDCTACPFYDLECDDDCKHCPCSAKCEDSREE